MAVWALDQRGARIEAQLYYRVVAEAGEVELANADMTASQSWGCGVDSSTGQRPTAFFHCRLSDR